MVPLFRRKLKSHSIGAAIGTAFTLTLQSEYPIATHQDRNDDRDRVRRQAFLSTAIQKARDRQRVGTGAAPMWCMSNAQALIFLAAVVVMDAMTLMLLA
jgi:hypothetical protein